MVRESVMMMIRRMIIFLVMTTDIYWSWTGQSCKHFLSACSDLRCVLLGRQDPYDERPDDKQMLWMEETHRGDSSVGWGDLGQVPRPLQLGKVCVVVPWNWLLLPCRFSSTGLPWLRRTAPSWLHSLLVCRMQGEVPSAMSHVLGLVRFCGLARELVSL